MPIYEYQCEACGRRSEAIQRLSDPPLSECSECGGPVRRLISAPAVQFKGSGWYVTDYAGRKSADKPEAKEAAAPAEGKADGKTESKTTKSEASSKASE